MSLTHLQRRGRKINVEGASKTKWIGSLRQHTAGNMLLEKKKRSNWHLKEGKRKSSELT